MSARLAVGSLALLLSACAGPRPAIPPAAEVAPPAQWRDGREGSDVAVDADWWRYYGDATLTGLVEEALAHNEDIEIAAARVAEARAQFAAARGVRMPQVQGVGTGGRTRNVNPFGIDVEQWAAQGEVQASFDLDLFGRLRTSAAAAKAQLLASDYSRGTVRLAVSAAVTTGYVQLVTLDERRAILRRTLDARVGSLKLIRRRAEAGYGSQLDLAQAEAEYEAAAQAIPPIDLAITKLENGLSILLGRTPGPIARGSAITALTIPAVPSQLPARVLRQRPDIAAAEQQIVAADRSLDAARAAFMPDIKLSVSGGFVASSLLPDNPLSIFSLGGSILAPIFNGGKIRAQADGAAARRDQAAFAYRRAALTAFREVEDGMASVERYGQQEEVLTRQQAALLRVQQLASRRYREGYSPYLEQLDAERSLLASQLSLVQARSDRLLASASLFQALGGGWQPLEHREGRSVTRMIMIVIFIVLAVFGSMAVKRCSEESPPDPTEAKGDQSAIVALADGSTMAVPRGTVGRDLVDWLAKRQPGQKTFELGGQEFVGRSAEPTAESLGRVSSLIAMLRANPDVKAVIVGHTDPSGDEAADRAISQARADVLLDMLRDGRISSHRLRTEARGASDPIAPNDSPGNRQRNQRVSLILSRTQ